MMPSPMRAEYHRWASDRNASMTARPAIIRASRMTVAAASEPPPVMALTTCPASTGVATPMPAASTTVIRKTEMSRRYGRAKRRMRRVVPRVS